MIWLGLFVRKYFDVDLDSIRRVSRDFGEVERSLE